MDHKETDFGQNVKSFKAQLESTGRASATILAYTKDIEQLGEFVKKTGKITASAITSEDIDAFKADLAADNLIAYLTRGEALTPLNAGLPNPR